MRKVMGLFDPACWITCATKMIHRFVGWSTDGARNGIPLVRNSRYFMITSGIYIKISNLNYPYYISEIYELQDFYINLADNGAPLQPAIPNSIPKKWWTAVRGNCQGPTTATGRVAELHRG